MLNFSLELDLVTIFVLVDEGDDQSWTTSFNESFSAEFVFFVNVQKRTQVYTLK